MILSHGRSYHRALGARTPHQRRRLLSNRAPNVKIKLVVAVEQRDIVREVHLLLDEPCAAVSS